MTPFTVGLFAFLFCVVISRMMSERALRSLDDDDKLKLMNAFSGMRSYSAVPLIVIFALAIGLPRVFPQFQSWSLTATLALVLVYVVVIHIVIVLRLNQLEVPSAYKRKFLLARHTSHLGMLVLFGCIFYDMMN